MRKSRSAVIPGVAKLLGGKLACTQHVVDRELLPYKLQVDQSGVMIKPKL